MKKNFISYFYIVILLTFGVSNVVFAKLGDTQSRQEVSIRYNPIKKLQLSGMYRLDLQENLSQFKKNNFELGVSYDMLKYMEISTYYRFSTSYESDAHRFYLGVSSKVSTENKKFKFKLATGIQFDSDYLDADYWKRKDPSFRWVTKFTGTYNISKKIDVSAYVKPYIRLNGNKKSFQKVRFGTDISYAINKQNEISLGYFYEYKPNSKQPSDIQTIAFEYKLSFKHKKKKKPKLKP